MNRKGIVVPAELITEALRALVSAALPGYQPAGHLVTFEIYTTGDIKLQVHRAGALSDYIGVPTQQRMCTRVAEPKDRKHRQHAEIAIPKHQHIAVFGIIANWKNKPDTTSSIVILR